MTIHVGDFVEWKPYFAPGMSRGRVTRIVDGRVYLMMPCRRKEGDDEVWFDSEVWFEPNETHRLVVVGSLVARLRALETLWANLAIVGALCASFDLGLYNEACGNVHPSVNWRPGCGWGAP